MVVLDELKNDFNAFLKENAFWICVILVSIVVIVATLLIVRGLNNKKYKNKEPIHDKSEWQSALGNKDNILEINAVGSRLNIKLKDKDLINRDKLTSLGVKNIIVMSDKVVLLVEDKANEIKNELEK